MAETEQLRKIFVGGLNWETSEETMKEYFSTWGNIVDCIIMLTPERSSRGFGFVTFDKAKCVDDCLKEKRHELDGRQIEPKRAVPKEETNNPSAHQKTKKIFVGGLASTTTEADIEEYFNKLLNDFGEGRIVDVDLKKDRDNPKRIRGFAYVSFDSEDVVEKLLIMRTHEIKMKHCEVKRAETQAAIRRKQERDGIRPSNRDRDRSSSNSHSGPTNNSLATSMAQNMQGGYGSQNGPAGGNWPVSFGGNFNPGGMGFGGYGPGFGGFGAGFPGFNPYASMASMASMGYGPGFVPGFGFGFGGGFGPGGGGGDRGSSGDSDRGSGRGSNDYGSRSDQGVSGGKGSDSSSSRDRSSAYPGFTGYPNMMGQNWPANYGSTGSGSTGDAKGGAGATTNPTDAFQMGNYSQVNSSYGPSRNASAGAGVNAWSLGLDASNANRMYKPY